MNSSASSEMNAFVRVIERGSFAAAAADLGLTPSALSKLVSRIESRLGVRLLTRTTRKLALTAEGELFVARSRDILASIEAAEAEVMAASERPRGHLRVAGGPSRPQQQGRRLVRRVQLRDRVAHATDRLQGRRVAIGRPVRAGRFAHPTRLTPGPATHPIARFLRRPPDRE